MKQEVGTVSEQSRLVQCVTLGVGLQSADMPLMSALPVRS